MKAGKIVKFTLVALLTLGLGVYIAYAMLFLSKPDENEKCVAVELTVKQDEKSAFIDKKDIEDILKAAHVYPAGMLMKDVDTEKIEQLIAKNEFISKVECYKSANGKLCISVEQRIPIIFVAPDGKDSYFVDSQGKIIPDKGNATNLVVANGDIDEKYASTKLAEFAQFLQGNEFWNDQIEQVYVQKNQKGERVVELVPRVGNHVVFVGKLDEYQRKLNKLETFYKKAVKTVGWEKYARVNLEYDGQIICTKRK